MKQSKPFAGKLLAILMGISVLLTSCSRHVVPDSGAFEGEPEQPGEVLSEAELRIAALSGRTLSVAYQNIFAGGAQLPHTGGDTGGTELSWYYSVFGQGVMSIPTSISNIVDEDALRAWRMEFGEHNTPPTRDRREFSLLAFIEELNISAGEIIAAQEDIFERPMAEIDALANWVRYGIDTGFTDPGEEWRWVIPYTIRDLEAMFSGDVEQIWEAFPGYGVLKNGNAFSPEWIMNNIEEAVIEHQIPLEEIERIIDLASIHDRLGDLISEVEEFIEGFLDSIVTGITLNQTAADISVGDTLELTVTILPEDADTAVTWASSDDSIAAVDENGVVTGVSVGTAAITAATVNGLTATCQVTVSERPHEPESVAVEALGGDFMGDGYIILYLTWGTQPQLIATIYPPEADQTVTWSSSSLGLPITEDGVVSIDYDHLYMGSVTVTATAVNGVTGTFEVIIDAPGR